MGALSLSQDMDFLRGLANGSSLNGRQVQADYTASLTELNRTRLFSYTAVLIFESPAGVIGKKQNRTALPSLTTEDFADFVRSGGGMFLFPPETPQHIAVVLRAAGLEPKFGLPALEWFRTEYQVLKRSRIAPLEVIQRPGDVIWVPEKWGHAVINLKPSVGFAMEIGFSS